MDRGVSFTPGAQPHFRYLNPLVKVDSSVSLRRNFESLNHLISLKAVFKVAVRFCR